METGQLIYSVSIAIFIGFGVLAYAKRDGLGKTAKMAVIWVALILGCVVAVTYWEEVKNTKFVASLIPGYAAINEDGSVTYIMADDGHFYINAIIDGRDVKFLLDTGATDITLSANDAKKVGFDLDNLNFTRIYNTANGQVKGASVKLESLSIGGVELHNVSASVNSGEMKTSLLGMSFLNSMSSFRVQGKNLTIYP